MTSNVLSKYLGRGLEADRPATPPVGTEEAAFWRSTDTGYLYVWKSAGWDRVALTADLAATDNQATSGTATIALAAHWTNLWVDTTSAAANPTLPAAGAAGREVFVKDVNGHASSHIITLAVTGGGTIDGSAALVINTSWGAATLVDNGTTWSIKS